MSKRRIIAALVAFLAVAAAACNGQPDPGFGTNGSVEAGVLLWDTTFDVAVQPDGKIVAVGASSNTWDGSAGQVFSAVRLNPNGTLDTSFSDDGKVDIDFDQFASERATSVVVLPNGRIVLGGTPYGGSGCEDGWLLAALNPDGTVATDEGNQRPVPNGTSVWHGNVFDEDIRLAGLSEMVVDDDGFLIAGGNVVSRFGGSFGLLFPDPTYGGRIGTEEGFIRVDDIPGESDCQTVYDISDNGSYIAAKSHIYDTSLNSLVHFPGPAIFASVHVQPDGKILASGNFIGATGPFRARFLPDGTGDTTFLGTYGPWENNGYQEGAAQDWFVQSDGRIVAFDGAVHRLNPNGTPDTSFGNDGSVSVPGGDAFVGGGFAVQPDGKYVAVGDEADDLDLDYWIGRFTP